MKWVTSVAWEPAHMALPCRRLASGSEDSSVHRVRWPKTTKSTAKTLNHVSNLRPGHTKWVTSVAWEPAHVALPCRRLASGSRDSSVHRVR